MNNLCIDIGGTKIKGGIFSGTDLIASRTLSSDRAGNFSSTLSSVELLSGKLAAEASVKKIHNIGISIPGIVDVKKNRIISINKKHAGAEKFNFNRWATKNFKARLTMENDARAALTGEWQSGAGKGYNNIVMITLGTGVGGAAMIGGELLYGKHYQAGCLGGHFTVNYNGDVCTCGNIGCVEAEASSWKLKQLAKRYPDLQPAQGDSQFDFHLLFRFYKEGNATAKDIIEHCLKVWSAGIISMIHAYDPELVIVGGGIMKSRSIIIPYIREWAEKFAWTPSEKVKIVAARSSDVAALYGLNYLIGKNSKKKR